MHHLSRRNFGTTLVFSAMAYLSLASGWQPRARSQEPSPVAKKLLDEFESLTARQLAILDKGTEREMGDLLREKFAFEKRVLSPDDRVEILQEQYRLLAGGLEQPREWYAAAALAWAEILELETKHSGPDHWRTKEARLAIKRVGRKEHADPAQRELLGQEQGLLKGIVEARRVFDYGKCADLAQALLNIREKTVGRDDPSYANTLHLLGIIHDKNGDDLKAQQFFQNAAERRRSMLGMGCPDTVDSYASLARVLMSLHQEREAVDLLSGVLDPAMDATSGIERARLLQLLAICLMQLGEDRELSKLVDRFMAILQKQNSPDWMEEYLFAAGLFVFADDFDQARVLAFRAWVMAQAREDVPAIHKGAILSILGLCEFRNGNLDRAASAIKGSVDFFKQHDEMNNAAIGDSLSILSKIQLLQGDATQSLKTTEEALSFLKRGIDTLIAGHSERQQIAIFKLRRDSLDGYLSAALAASTPAGSMYTKVLQWKGGVFAAQALTRKLENSPDHAKLLERRRNLARQIASQYEMSPLAIAVGTKPDPENARWLRKATIDLDEIDGELIHRNPDFQRLHAQSKCEPEALRIALPDGTALIDFLEFRRFLVDRDDPSKRKTENHFLAFVVRNDRAITVRDIGPSAPIRELVERWHEVHIGGKPGGGDVKPTEVAMRIREAVWLKVADDLDGVKTVLISPDGVLAGFPFAALPGDKTKYLIEERAIGIVISPQVLPTLLAKPARMEPTVDPTLLIVGDVDYGRDSKLIEQRFAPLAETGDEVRAIQRLFLLHVNQSKKAVSSPTRDQATKQRFIEDSKDRSFIHLSTHAFIEPDETRDALKVLGRQKDGPGVGLPYLADLYYLGQLSGLAFAGANWRPLEGDRGPGIGDAILRGLEVTGLNLGSTQLVALPACDTGRGPLINGEGVLGLQRAFEVAGARSVLASLWKVDDNATHALMEEFYEALWAGRTATGGPISKIEALRQAQVMMIHRYDVGTKTIRLRGELGKPVPFDPKKMVEKEGAARTDLLPPWFWAAFTLSGDWR